MAEGMVRGTGSAVKSETPTFSLCSRDTAYGWAGCSLLEDIQLRGVIQGWAPVFTWVGKVYHFLIHTKGLPGLFWARPAAVKERFFY